MKVIFDIETDGLEPTLIHCMSWCNIDDPDYIHTVSEYEDIKNALDSFTTMIGHNIILYDIPALERILGVDLSSKELIDTLALSYYIYPTRTKRKLSHGLAAMGEAIGIPKPVIEDWEGLSLAEYQHRCEEDVKINYRVYEAQMTKIKKIYKDKKDMATGYLAFKFLCSRECQKNPVYLDIASTWDKETTLNREIESINEDLKLSMPPIEEYKTKNIWKSIITFSGFPRKTTIAQRIHMCNIRRSGTPHEVNLENGYYTFLHNLRPPNPNSPEQVKSFLFTLGWVPKTYKKVVDKKKRTTKRIPQVKKGSELCPSVKALIDKAPAIAFLDRLTVYRHRYGLIKGFLRDCSPKGTLTAKMHGFTNTLRLRHRELVNLPGVKDSEKDPLKNGRYIRECLIPGPNRVFCGADISALETMTKLHYMYPYDPEYVKTQLTEDYDPHLDLALFDNAVTQEEVDRYKSGEHIPGLSETRHLYKTCNYAATYLVGAAHLAETLEVSQARAKAILDAYWSKNWALTRFTEDMQPYVKAYGRGEKWVYNPVSHIYYNLVADKDIFSTINQSTGAYIFDLWVKKTLKRLRPEDSFHAQFHDEMLLSLPDTQEDRDRISSILQEAMDEVNELLALNVEIKMKPQFGYNYAEVH